MTRKSKLEYLEKLRQHRRYDTIKFFKFSSLLPKSHQQKTGHVWSCKFSTLPNAWDLNNLSFPVSSYKHLHMKKPGCSLTDKLTLAVLSFCPLRHHAHHSCLLLRGHPETLLMFSFII